MYVLIARHGGADICTTFMVGAVGNARSFLPPWQEYEAIRAELIVSPLRVLVAKLCQVSENRTDGSSIFSLFYGLKKFMMGTEQTA